MRKSLSLVSFCAANLLDQIFWSPQIICSTLVEWGERQGEQGAGDGRKREQTIATFEKPKPAKLFVYHLMPTQKENFLFVSLLRQRS